MFIIKLHFLGVFLTRLVALLDNTLLVMVLHHATLVFKHAQVVGAAPKQILDELREAQVNNSFEKIVDQLFPLNAVSAGALSKTLDDGADFLLSGAFLHR